MTAPYISFEGPIGAGKTTLATMLSVRLSATLVLENVEDNAFLQDFYADRERWVLPMQQWFLVSRWHQLSGIMENRAEPVVSDFSVIKDAVFARLLLKGREWELYERLATALGDISAKPGIIVLLDADDDVLLQRIRHRNRPYEANVGASYLQSQRAAYINYFAERPSIRSLRRDTSKLDLKNEAELSEFFVEITSSVPSASNE